MLIPTLHSVPLWRLDVYIAGLSLRTVSYNSITIADTLKELRADTGTGTSTQRVHRQNEHCLYD